MLQSWQSREIEIDRDVFLIFTGTPEGPFYIKLSTTTTVQVTAYSASPSLPLPFSLSPFKLSYFLQFYRTVPPNLH